MITSAVVFCDFDGTVTERDVGYWLFHHFSGGKNEMFVPAWKEGKLSSRELLTKEAELINVSPTQFYDYLNSFELSPGFIEFERLCRIQAIPLFILSDGLNLYIDHIFARFNLTHLAVRSNRGYLESNGIRIEFPYKSTSCPRCGNCKKDRIIELRAELPPTSKTVLIGDGLSDACAAQVADIVFAKKDLARYCQTFGISYNTYQNFFDVTAQLRKLGIMQMSATRDTVGRTE